VTILITRPSKDAEDFAAKLAERGTQAMVEPLSVIEYLPPIIIPDPAIQRDDKHWVDGIIITSRHALESETARALLRETPLFVVGNTSAAKAQAMGFSNVHMAGENVEALAAHVQRHCEHSPILYLRGEHVSHDLKTLLPACAIEERVVYTATLVPQLSDDCISALQNKQITGVAFFSSRHAKHFATLCERHYLPHLTAYCMSEAIANTIRSYPWKNIVISPSQNAASMLETIHHGK
jgi:uroporphyrinogen-III synthase